jgi:hypothetical protein
MWVTNRFGQSSVVIRKHWLIAYSSEGQFSVGPVIIIIIIIIMENGTFKKIPFHFPDDISKRQWRAQTVGVSTKPHWLIIRIGNKKAKYFFGVFTTKIDKSNNKRSLFTFYSL